MTDDQLEMTCGGCEFWRPSDVLEDPAMNDAPPGEAPQPKPGHCWRYPPTGYLTQAVHPLTQKPIMGTIAVRPPVTDRDPACGEFESNEAPELLHG